MVVTIVHANMINKEQFSFICPFCFSNYKKNGEPRKGSKHLKHFHGSSGDLNNRVENRVPHCMNERYRGSFDIIIDDSTKRY
jgi:hypothetical protein